MKITIDIPDHELSEAMRHTGASTRREAVVTALVDFNRYQRLSKLVKRFGTFEAFPTHDDLRKQRSEG